MPSRRFVGGWLLALSLIPGCAKPPVPPARFSAKTDGSAGAKLAHIEQLSGSFKQQNSPNHFEARRAFRTYSDAVIDTAWAVLDDASATDAERLRAGEAIFDQVNKQLEIDPAEAVAKLDATCDRVEKRWPDTPLSSLAAYERVRTTAEAPDESFPNELAKFDKVAAAATQLGRAKPHHPETPLVVSGVAVSAEGHGRTEKARELYKILVDRFPESPNSRFAKGALNRLELKGKVVDDFKGPGIDGKPVDLRDYRGKVVLIHYWSSNAPESRAEIPEIVDTYQKLAPRGLEIISVSLDASSEPARLLRQRGNATWPQIHTPIGNPSTDPPPPLATQYGISSVPFHILIDRKGRLVASASKFQDIKPALEALLKEPADAKKEAPASPPKAQ